MKSHRKKKSNLAIFLKDTCIETESGFRVYITTDIPFSKEQQRSLSLIIELGKSKIDCRPEGARRPNATDIAEKITWSYDNVRKATLTYHNDYAKVELSEVPYH